MSKDDLIKLLGEALTEAGYHLDYCSYGDSRERECAEEAELPEQIVKALEEYKNFLEE